MIKALRRLVSEWGWFKDAFREWRSLLVTRPPVVAGRPNPEALDLLQDIDLLLKAQPQIVAARLRALIRWLVPPAATITLLYVMFTACSHNIVSLSAKASSVSFKLDSPGETPILKELFLRRLVASPVDSFRPCTDKSNPLESSNLDREGGTVTITPANGMRLNTFTVPAGARVTFGFPEGQPGLRVRLEYPMSVLEVSGTASALASGQSCDFSFQTQGTAVQLTMDLDDPALTEPAYGQIPISEVEFEFPGIELGRSLSSVNSAALSFDEIPDAKYNLGRGARLAMNIWKGTLADLQISNRELSLRLQADVSRIRLGYWDQRDITPTKLDWLRTRTRNIELWIGAVYFTVLLFGLGLPQLKGMKG